MVSLGVAYLLVSFDQDCASWTYSLTQARAVSSCCFLFVRYSDAILGTRGSEGFGSVRSEERDRMTL